MPAELAALAGELAHVNSTTATAQFIRTHLAAFRSSWKLSKTIVVASDMPMPPPRSQGLHPRGSSVEAAFMRMKFRLTTTPERQVAGFPALAEYQVRITGRFSSQTCTVMLEDHWRIDTDLYASDPKPSKEPHPLYHFQRGGHAQDSYADAETYVPGPRLGLISGTLPWRASFQTPGPRMLCMPMCPLIAIDFAIAQSDGLTWRRLRGRPQYLELMRAAQNRLWGAFFEAIKDPLVQKKWLGPIMV